jgi:hypothetical protein
MLSVIAAVRQSTTIHMLRMHFGLSFYKILSLVRNVFLLFFPHLQWRILKDNIKAIDEAIQENA